MLKSFDMFTFSNIYATLSSHGSVTERTVRDFTANPSSTNDEDAVEDQRASRLHSLISCTDSADDGTRGDSGICFDDLPHSRGGSISHVDLTFDEHQSTEHRTEASEPFPELNPYVMEIGHLDADGPPTLQGFPLADVENALERHRDDSFSSALENDDGGFSSLKSADIDEDHVKELDTTVDFASVSRSSSSVSLEHFDQDLQLHSDLEEQPERARTTPRRPTKGKKRSSESLHDPFGPRYQLTGEDMSDNLKRVSARCQATLARYNPKNKVRAYSSCSSNASSSGNSSNLEDEDNPDSCPSSPPTPLNRYNLSKPRNIDTSSKPESPASDCSSEWRAPSMVGPPIFDISKTKMTPPRKEVYKHINFCPQDLFHFRGRNRIVLLQQDCLQCVLKNMKCDRIHPCCSRCVRSGEAPYCLHQRQLPRWELQQLGLEGIRYVVPIRLPEEDDNFWEDKLRREDVLLEQLQEKIDRSNWVLPVNNGEEDIFDEDAIQGKQLCEQRGKMWQYKMVNDGLGIAIGTV